MKKLTEYPFVASLRNFFNRISLPGFQGEPIGKVMSFFVKALSKGIIFHRAAAMTYRIFIALIPLLMALFSAISFLGENVRATILSFIQSMVPEYVWPAVSNIINEVVNNQNGTLLSFSFFFGTFFFVISINASINILNTNYYRSQRRTFLKQIGVVIGLTFTWLIIILLVVGVFITASAGFSYLDTHYFRSPQLLHTAVNIAKWLLLWFLVYLFISSFYYIAPADRKNYSFFSAGSSFAAIAMVLVLGALNFYFANFGNYNVLYGSLGAIFAILLWLYWNAMFILIGFDLNVSIAAAKKFTSHQIPPKK